VATLGKRPAGPVAPAAAVKRPRIFGLSFASVYPLYVSKAEGKGRTKSEVDAVIRWITGYGQRELEGQLADRKDFTAFFREAPRLNPARTLIKGVVCGVRVETVPDPLMREIRRLDKLVDELAKGKAPEKILRAEGGTAERRPTPATGRETPAPDSSSAPRSSR
jgi:hypothetical protein